MIFPSNSASRERRARLTKPAWLPSSCRRACVRRPSVHGALMRHGLVDTPVFRACTSVWCTGGRIDALGDVQWHAYCCCALTAGCAVNRGDFKGRDKGDCKGERPSSDAQTLEGFLMSISCGRCRGWAESLVGVLDVLENGWSACEECSNHQVMRVVAKQFQSRESQWWVVDGRVVIPVWIVEHLRNRLQIG